MALAGARSSAGRLSEWTMPPHPLPARLRAAEGAHGVVDGRARALLELGDPPLRLLSALLGLLLLDPHARGDVLLAQHALLLGGDAQVKEIDL